MMLGLGAMLWELSGGTKHDAAEFYGRTIKAAAFSEGEVKLTFDDGTAIEIFDGGQSCCESRYFTTDDEVLGLVGHTLKDIKLRSAPDEYGEYGDVHEITFLEIATEDGHVTVASHNEHNGYYGGICLAIRVPEDDTKDC